MKLGIFGGSFDPIHVGHLLIAEACRDYLGLDRVRFIPAFVSPLKSEHPPILAKHRVQMVRLAVGGNPAFEVDTREIDRGDISFTIDTLSEVRQELAEEDELFLILGVDSLNDFSRWKAPDALLELATLAIVERGGVSSGNLNRLSTFVSSRSAHPAGGVLVPFRQIEISSTELRDRISTKRSIRYQVPAAVASYIRANELYQ